MKVAGIICEYNPLHNGHLYHIEQTRDICNADYIICVMSGNFTQRGEPACCDKYLRTKTALLAGCDLVIELPVRYATSSAEGFAVSAVNTLASLGIVTDLCFGSESGNPDTLSKVSDILVNEPAEYSSVLKNSIKSGISYPAARQKALDICTGITDISYTPNNILAIEYLRACKNLHIVPHTIKRTDKGYLTDNLYEHAENICSSSAIRRYINNNKDTSLLKNYMPEEAYSLIPENIINTNDFSALLYSQLQNNSASLHDYLDVSGDIANRIKRNLYSFTGFESFATLIKSKQITYTRVMRALTHIMLGIKKYDIHDTPSLNEKYPVSYIRVLGFKKGSEKLMKLIAANSSVPVITRPAAAENLIDSSYGKMLFEEDIRSADIYRYIQTTLKINPTAKNEYSHGLVII